MKIFSHKHCADGVAAAAVVDYWYRKIEKACSLDDVKHIPILYNETFPIDDIEKDEVVFIVDFSLQVDDMKALLKKTKKIRWIDHHKSAIEKYDNEPKLTKQIKGIRSNDRSGAYLAWQFLAPDKDVPRALEYVDDHDRWIHQYEDSDAFRQGMLLYSGGDPTNALFWDPLLEGGEEELQQCVDAGKILEANSDMWRRKAKGYVVEFEGLKFLCMNKPGNSKAFEYIDDGKCDALMTWHFTGKEYIYTMFHSKKGEKDGIDLSKIALKHGGGGHKGACGFHSQEFIADPRKKSK